MSRRIVVEEPCEHGMTEMHDVHGPLMPGGLVAVFECFGGSRLVLDGIPDEWVEAAVVVLKKADEGRYLTKAGIAKAVLAAVLFGTP